MSLNEIQNSTQIKNINNSQQFENVKVLKEGSSTRVVVIAEKGNGKYQGIVAGVRVNITSKNPLAVGSSFNATVLSKNGVIHLVPQNQNYDISDFSVIEQSQNQFVQFLSAFGLPQDSLSTSIMYQLKQLGMTFDSGIIKKIYTLASRFKDKEKIAAFIISILKEKGIEAAENEIKKMINDLDFEKDESQFSEKIKFDKETDSFDNLLFNQLMNFINQLMETESGKTGLLSISNHIKRRLLNSENWIFIPFEIVNGIEEKNILGRGNIKISLNYENVLNKILLEYKAESTFRFLLLFENNRLKEIKMNISNLQESLIDVKVKELSKKMKVGVEYFTENELENTAAESEPFYSVGGLV